MKFLLYWLIVCVATIVALAISLVGVWLILVLVVNYFNPAIWILLGFIVFTLFYAASTYEKEE